jgi:hypothetical protein
MDSPARGAPVYSGWKAQQEKLNAATEQLQEGHHLAQTQKKAQRGLVI